MDPERVEEVYKELDEYSVELDREAWSLGPKHLHDLISKTRGYINAVTFILQEILKEKQSLDRDKHAKEASFKVEADRLLAEDERVRRCPSIDDRRATLNLILRDRLNEIAELDAALLDLGYVEKAVRHRYNELKATMTDIRAQRSLMRDALDTGSFYGDETETSRKNRTGGRPSDEPSEMIEQDDIDQVMSEINTQLTEKEDSDFSDLLVEEPSSSGSSPEPPQSVVVEAVPDHKPEESEIEAFLDGEDLSDLLSD